MWIRVHVTIHIFVCRSIGFKPIKQSEKHGNTLTHTISNFASFCIIFSFRLAFFGFENMIHPRDKFLPARTYFALSSSLVPRLLRAAGLGTRRSEVILRIAVSLCVDSVERKRRTTTSTICSIGGQRRAKSGNVNSEYVVKR